MHIQHKEYLSSAHFLRKGKNTITISLIDFFDNYAFMERKGIEFGKESRSPSSISAAHFFLPLYRRPGRQRGVTRDLTFQMTPEFPELPSERPTRWKACLGRGCLCIHCLFFLQGHPERICSVMLSTFTSIEIRKI